MTQGRHPTSNQDSSRHVYQDFFRSK
jgi:hypothetical protein